jgi:hypothetical protein
MGFLGIRIPEKNRHQPSAKHLMSGYGIDLTLTLDSLYKLGRFVDLTQA